LKLNYHIIRPEDFRAWIEQGKALPERAVLLTCDDGLLNTLTDMLPVLQTEGLSCLFFVTGASCSDHPGMLWYEELYHLFRTSPALASEVYLPANNGQEPLASSASLQAKWWDAVLRASQLEDEARAEWLSTLRKKSSVPQSLLPERRWRLLNACQLKQMAQAGVSIGAHTLSHPVLSRCREEEVRREIARSKSEIERVLERPVWAFAYPFGDPLTMGEREVRIAREAGFACAFLNVGGVANRSNPFALSRCHVTADMNLAEFEAHLSGFHSRLQRLIRG
jgi:peptidoglycan/xylan/chitin deacetylase (PgdA/CDA1 family)